MTAIPILSRTGYPLGTRPAGSPIGSPRTGVVKLTCYGSSTTFGTGSTNNEAWRLPLATLLDDLIARGKLPSSLVPTWVGPFTSGSPPTDNHFGIPGATVATLITNNPNYFPSGKPFHDVDVVVSHAVGLNNCANDTLFADLQGADDTKSYLGWGRQMKGFLPNAVYLLSDIPRCGDVAERVRIDTFNTTLWPAWVSTLASEGMLIVTYTNRELAYNAQFASVDSVHQKDDGYGVTAAGMLAALCNSLGYPAQW